MSKINLEEFFSKNPEIEYPFKVIEEANAIPIKRVFTFISKINGHSISSLLLNCNTDEIRYFGIGFPPPKPLIKFRMLDLEKKDYLIEIVLYFDNGKNLKLHLNPKNKIVREYLRLAIKTQLIALHFYDKENEQMIDSITNLNEEELAWLKRNYKLAKNISGNERYIFLSRYVREEMTDDNNERSYEFHNVEGKEFIINSSSKPYKMNVYKSYKSRDDND